MSPARRNDASRVSPKVTAAAVGGAASTLLWTLLVVFVDPVRDRLGEGALTAVTGASGTIFSFIFGYFTRDSLR